MKNELFHAGRDPDTTEIPDGVTRPQDDPVEVFHPYDLLNAPTVHVPGEVASISAAILELGDHGRVVVAPGSYRDNIKIRPGTYIIIQADGPEHPELFAAEPKVPVVHIAPGAELHITGMSVNGTKSGLVAGSEATGEAAHAVTLLDTHVTNAKYGIYGSVTKFNIERSIVERNVYGMVVAGSTYVANTVISGNMMNVVLTGGNIPSCAEAAYDASSGAQVSLKQVTIGYGKKGGLAICNVKSATLDSIYVIKNGYIGVQIRNTPMFKLTHSNVRETQYLNGEWGDGLVVVKSNGLVKQCQFSANKRANMIYYGKSGGTIDGNLIIYAVFAIDLEEMEGACPDPDILGNNYMYGNTENRVTFGSQLCPTPIPPPPSL
jgi:hypothetical protein